MTNIVPKDPKNVVINVGGEYREVETGFFDLFIENQTKAELIAKLKDYPQPTLLPEDDDIPWTVEMKLYTDSTVLPTKAHIEGVIEALRLRTTAGFETHGNLESIDFILNVAYGFNPEMEGYEFWARRLVIAKNPDTALTPAFKLHSKFRQEKIAEYGFTVTAVGSSEDSNPFAYTLGLVDQVGFELFTTAGANPNTLGGIVNYVAHKLNTGEWEGIPTEPLQARDWIIGNAPLRLCLKEAVVEQWFTPTPKLYQILIADRNNVLPGEDGYDTTFDQSYQNILPTP